MKFSIIIPVYNAENYLRKCINSVLNQTYKTFELILVNDGSTDSSKDICSDYMNKDSRVKLYNQSNQGHTLARRKGISEATGTYLLFLDSDDFWDVNLLEIVNQITHKNDIDMVLYKYKKVDEKGNILYTQSSLFDEKYNMISKSDVLIKMSKSSDVNPLWNKAIHNRIMDNHNYKKYKGIKTAEDLIQTLPWIDKSERIFYVDKPLYNYRATSGSITQSFHFKKYQDITIARNQLLRFLIDKEKDTEYFLIPFYEFYLNSMLSYINTLGNEKISLKVKIETFKEIKTIELFNQSTYYTEHGRIRLENKLTLFLLKRNNFTLLIIYSKIIFKVKKLIKRMNNMLKN